MPRTFTRGNFDRDALLKHLFDVGTRLLPIEINGGPSRAVAQAILFSKALSRRVNEGKPVPRSQQKLGQVRVFQRAKVVNHLDRIQGGFRLIVVYD